MPETTGRRSIEALGRALGRFRQERDVADGFTPDFSTAVVGDLIQMLHGPRARSCRPPTSSRHAVPIGRLIVEGLEHPFHGCADREFELHRAKGRLASPLCLLVRRPNCGLRRVEARSRPQAIPAATNAKQAATRIMGGPHTSPDIPATDATQRPQATRIRCPKTGRIRGEITGQRVEMSTMS